MNLKSVLGPDDQLIDMCMFGEAVEEVWAG